MERIRIPNAVSRYKRLYPSPEKEKAYWQARPFAWTTALDFLWLYGLRTTLSSFRAFFTTLGFETALGKTLLVS